MLAAISSRDARPTSGRRRRRTSPTGRSPPASARRCRRAPSGGGRTPTCRTRSVSDDRSVVAQSGCSSSAPVWWGSVYGSVTRSRAISASASPGSKVSCITQHPPAASVEPMAVLSPAVQNIGSDDHMRVCSWRPKICACTQNCSVGGAVGVQHPLRLAGGARAEDHHGVVVGRDGGARRRSTALGCSTRSARNDVPRRRCRRRRRGAERPVRRARRGRRRSERVEQALLGEDDADLGPLEHEGELGLGANVDSGTATPPASATPKSAATASGRLPMRMPAGVPSPSPCSSRPSATRRASRRRSA